MATAVEQPTFLQFGVKAPKLPDGTVVKNAHVLNPKKFKFQVMSGGTFQSRPALDDDGNLIVEPMVDAFNNPVKDKTGKEVFAIKMVEIVYGPRRKAGDIIDSDVDMVKKFNRPNSVMYKRLDEQGNPVAAELQQQKLKASAATARYHKALDKMSVAELRDHAEELKVDTKGATRKEELVRVIIESTADEV